MIDGFRAYKFFMATKLHFTSEKYDVFEKGGRVNGSRAAFEKRNDKGLFEKLGMRFDTERELIQFYVANFAYGNKNLVYSAESDSYYRRWLKNKESITRVFDDDLNKIINHLEFNKINSAELYSVENCMPELLNMYLGGYIQLETMAILDNLENYLIKWDPLIMLWHDHFLVIEKSKPFVKYDETRIQLPYKNFTEQLKELTYG